MPEVIFNGADGRLEGRYHHGGGGTAPLAVILHPHPLHGGTMNNKIVYDLFHVFARRGIALEHRLNVVAQGFEHSPVSHFGIAFQSMFTLREHGATILHFGFQQQRVCSPPRLEYKPPLIRVNTVTGARVGSAPVRVSGLRAG